MTARALRIDAADNVATLLDDGHDGEHVMVGDAGVALRGDVARGHKVALAAVAAGDALIKYGAPIGRATRAIAAGEHVHSDNLATALSGTLDYHYQPAPRTVPAVAAPGVATQFLGYRRADGRVGTRNEIWILPTVGCVARTAERIAARAAATLGDAVDGVHAFTHPFGCSQLGHDLDGTRAILASLACHPNAGGVLIVGLGCENNQIKALLEEVPAWRRPAIRTLVTQLSGDEVAEGAAMVAELAEAARCERSAVGLDALVLGVKCGGSDGLSGLTANPLVGRISDRVTAAGGQVILTEIPEIFGAEQLLMNRAADERVFGAIVGLVNDFKQYFLDHGEPVSDNPSPGNVAGGITTLEEKSLGAVQKAGRAAVADVIGYGERIGVAGLTLLEAPGNDAVSSTALAAAGATVILFTTGRGTPLGFPVPTIKISSNSDLARRKPGWIDFDAGSVLDNGFDAAEGVLLDRISAIASGAETAAERNGEREIAIWKRGVTL
ncbi:altronate dehydratase family protein [Sphingomonas sp. AR_OL41]|uniref:UxaA family hydrolase n=1 Tax=Sphingomonas sp. AR_OL41 TaxID=3042729 RepID=UPI0024816CF3|nr:altronate dehydratase family protein [Sphingomonas sp. AR_OL41]MDH7974388.1 altronate dehydratase family protein [Sphingomonas sp. AR_OL41]